MGRPAGSKNKMVDTRQADALMAVFGYTRAESCGTCRHYDAKTETCHAVAPSPRMAPGSSSQAGESVLWPIVGPGDWCGDYAKKVMEVETK